WRECRPRSAEAVRILALIAFALAALNLILVAFLIGRRFWLERAERRRRAAAGRVRPAVLALIDGDERAGAGLAGIDADAFASLLGRYAVALRGEARSRITRWFEEHGAVARELARLRDRLGAGLKRRSRSGTWARQRLSPRSSRPSRIG